MVKSATIFSRLILLLGGACKDLIPTPGNGSSIHGRTWQQVRPCMRDLAAGLVYIEGKTRRREDETRPDRTGQKEGSGSEKAGDKKNVVEEKRTARRWILQSVNIFIIYSFFVMCPVKEKNK
ncbi:hypothetical protein TNCT_681031 [Trichonephila clavata]|uniref:Uncharacterized protein n=1 Tax=Trichonephila clavata TaxID=2740835 RepID=A0A8X6HTJ8_TRICU|nr:hypothetical protein TNCT_681031 [Trichonephila clavata]